MAVHSVATRTGGRFVPKVQGDSAAAGWCRAEARIDCSAAAPWAWAGLPAAGWDPADCPDVRRAAPVDWAADDCLVADSSPAGCSVAARDDCWAEPPADDHCAKAAGPDCSVAVDSVQADSALAGSAEADSAPDCSVAADLAVVDLAPVDSAVGGSAPVDWVADGPADLVAADCSAAP